MHLSCKNLSSLQLKPSLYEITVSYAAVRLTITVPAKSLKTFCKKLKKHTIIVFFKCSLLKLQRTLPYTVHLEYASNSVFVWQHCF